jgi:hypothetical protein
MTSEENNFKIVLEEDSIGRTFNPFGGREHQSWPRVDLLEEIAKIQDERRCNTFQVNIIDCVFS